MKKYRFSILLALGMVSVALFFHACQKEHTAPEIENVTDVPPVGDGEITFRSTGTYDPANFDNMLNTAAVGLLELSQNSQFRTLVNAEVAKQFDGDDNALLKTIASEAQAQLQMDLVTEFSNSISYHNGNFVGTGGALSSHFQGLSVYTTTGEISESIFAFEDDGDTLYIQIYIPSYDSVNLNSNPVIVPMTNGEYEGIGYKLRGDGFYDVLFIDETILQTDLVWVISVNETVDNDGEIEDRSPCTNNEQDGDEAGIDCGGLSCPPCPPDGGPNRFKHVVLTGVYISNPKEGWLAGKCDFAFIGYQFRDGCDDDDWQGIGVMSSAVQTSCPGENDEKWFEQYDANGDDNELNEWHDYPYNTGYKWRSRIFAWNYSQTYNKCPDDVEDQRPSQLLRFPVGNNEEKIRIMFFERDQTNKKHLHHPNCSSNSKRITYKSEQTSYATETWGYDFFISQCDWPPGWPTPTNPDDVPLCYWTTTELDLDGAKIRLRVKEQW